MRSHLIDAVPFSLSDASSLSWYDVSGLWCPSISLSRAPMRAVLNCSGTVEVRGEAAEATGFARLVSCPPKRSRRTLCQCQRSGSLHKQCAKTRNLPRQRFGGTSHIKRNSLQQSNGFTFVHQPCQPPEPSHDLCRRQAVAAPSYKSS